VRLLLDFADPAKVDEHEVPDPYYGSDEGFERALDLVQLGCEGLLAALVQGLPRKPVN
jgi:protein-tyrosine phosphatase